jgi:hypothetical protein
MEYYSGTNNNEILSFATTWMELEIIKYNKPATEGQVSHDLTHM